MRSKGKITEEVVLVRYYNVLFYLFFRAGIDDFKRQCKNRKSTAANDFGYRYKIIVLIGLGDYDISFE